LDFHAYNHAIANRDCNTDAYGIANAYTNVNSNAIPHSFCRSTTTVLARR